MAIGAGSLIEVSLMQSFLSGNSVMNVFQYLVQGTFGPAGASAVGEAWWNHVKDEYRAICTTNASPFRSVLVRELDDPAGAYGEYSIPTSEWPGTRPPPAGDWMPMFVTAGVRLTVDTRVTRPGQKRFSYLTESDCDGTYLSLGYSVPLGALMDVLTTELVLGAPVAGGSLLPIITKKDGATGAVLAHQPVTGYIINNAVTHQVSRRVGRGA